jgi:hypothetical protein
LAGYFSIPLGDCQYWDRDDSSWPDEISNPLYGNPIRPERLSTFRDVNWVLVMGTDVRTGKYAHFRVWIMPGWIADSMSDWPIDRTLPDTIRESPNPSRNLTGRDVNTIKPDAKLI